MHKNRGSRVCIHTGGPRGRALGDTGFGGALKWSLYSVESTRLYRARVESKLDPRSGENKKIPRSRYRHRYTHLELHTSTQREPFKALREHRSVPRMIPPFLAVSPLRTLSLSLSLSVLFSPPLDLSIPSSLGLWILNPSGTTVLQIIEHLG